MRGLTLAIAIATALAALAATATAQPKVGKPAPKLQVLQAEGRADAKIRAKIDAAILALAKAGGEQVLPGDITFGDAAAAVGCRPEDASCKDEVLGMLSVDEIVITTVTPKPGGFEVAVRRAGKGGAAREAMSFVPADKLDKLDPIAPLFSKAPPATAPAGSPPRPAPTGPTATGPATVLPATAPPTTAPPTTAPPTGPMPAAPPGTAGVPPGPGAAITERPPSEIAPTPPSAIAPRGSALDTSLTAPYDDGRGERPRGRRLPLIGMAGGGALLVVGLALWGSAASVQAEIDDAPVSTKADLRALQQLEERGDNAAAAGNLFVVGGLVLGGVSTYYFVKSRRARTRSARLVPTVLPGGGGIALSIGGLP